MTHTELGFWILVPGGKFGLKLLLCHERDFSFAKTLDPLESIKENSMENYLKVRKVLDEGCVLVIVEGVIGSP